MITMHYLIFGKTRWNPGVTELEGFLAVDLQRRIGRRTPSESLSDVHKVIVVEVVDLARTLTVPTQVSAQK